MTAQRARLRGWLLVAGLSVAHLAAADEAVGPTEEIRDGFESPRTIWRQEQTDATINLRMHDRSTRAAHEGRSSEHFQFGAGLGSSFFYSYALPNVPVTPQLKASVYVRATRAGIQLFAKVVLPADTDPDTKRPSFLLIPGTIYSEVDRWQRLTLEDLPATVERQARVLRASTRRPVKLDGAYVEQLVVNLFTGTGETEAFLDELAIGPLPVGLASAHADLQKEREGIVGPGNPELAAEPLPNATVPGADAPPVATGQGRVQIERNRLKRRLENGLLQDWVFTAIHAPGADLASLRNAGFDVLIDDLDTDPKRWGEAVARGFMLMPRVRRGEDGALPTPESLAASIAAFPQKGSVAAWYLGDALGRAADPEARREERTRARALISALRGLPEGSARLTTGTVADDLPRYASFPRNLDLLGVRPLSWASSWEPNDTYQFLKQRRDLAARGNPGALFWAVLPASPTPESIQSIWGRDVPPAWGFPTVQPEHLRLYSYAALMAGYRGLAFEGDVELTRGQGRMLLLEMALLNAEVDLFESILANGADPIPVYNAVNPDPPALPPPGGGRNVRVQRQREHSPIPGILGAGIGTRDRKGVLLVVADLAPAAQFQPPQMSRNDMNMTLIVPEGAQAFEVSPGRVRVLNRERGVGGTRITLEEFDTTALVLVTTDVDMAERVESVVKGIAPRAAQMAIEQAELRLAWVTEVNGRLAELGHYLVLEKERERRRQAGESVPTDQADLLARAAENIKAARENLERENYAEAWSEARRASRPLRILMRGLWDNAFTAMLKANSHPEDLANEELLATGRASRKGPPLILAGVSSPALASFNTLPQHYLWVDWMNSGRFGRSLVPSGTFDDPEALEQSGWANESYRHEGIQSKVATVPNSPDGRRRIIKMTVEPAQGVRLEDLPPFLDAPAAAIRSPGIPVRTGEFLRISVYVQRSVPSPPGGGGIIIRDSIGGEAHQFVSSQPIPALNKVVLYRRAPADGLLTVTLGLAGYGEAFFDEFTVERVEAEPQSTPADVATTPAQPRREAAAPTARRPAPTGRASR